MPEITGVAIKVGNTLHTLPKPYRHHHILSMIRTQIKQGKLTRDHLFGEQGFILQDGQFTNRREGAKIATQNGIKLKTPPDLFSEDLW